MLSKFSTLSKARVKELRNGDAVVAAVEAAQKPITFSWLREGFKRDSGLWGSLNRGRAILGSTAQLDQYLYSYGNMIQSQWKNVLNGVQIDDEKIRIIDYGCGQGIAGLVISDHLGAAFGSTVSEVILIEPSEVAIVRAEAVYRNLLPKAQIDCHNLFLDDLDRNHFTQSAAQSLHIFSNILDIHGFDQLKVFDASLTNGNHAILAVGNNRDVAGGTARVRAIKDEMDNLEYKSWLTVHNSELHEFKCGDGGKFDAISWIANLSVDRG